MLNIFLGKVPVSAAQRPSSLSTPGSGPSSLSNPGLGRSYSPFFNTQGIKYLLVLTQMRSCVKCPRKMGIDSRGKEKGKGRGKEIP